MSKKTIIYILVAMAIAGIIGAYVGITERGDKKIEIKSEDREDVLKGEENIKDEENNLETDSNADIYIQTSQPQNEETKEEKQEEIKRTYPIVDTGVNVFYSNDASISTPQKGDLFYGQDAQYDTNTPSYKDNGDGTVTDLVTGLMWQKDMGEKM